MTASTGEQFGQCAIAIDSQAAQITISSLSDAAGNLANHLKPYVDIGVIVPLLEEYQRLELAFPVIEQIVGESNFHSRHDTGECGLSMVAYLQDDMGKTSAVHATERLLSTYRVGVVIVLGIAGGLSGDVAVGDVCYTGTVADVLDNAKISDKDGRQIVEYNTAFFKTDSTLKFSATYSKLGQDIKPYFEHWQLEQYYKAIALVPGEFIGRNDKNEIIGIPDIHTGTIICGQVGKSDVYKSNLQNIDRKVLVLETESGGVFSTAELHGNTPALSIRGVCDYSDKNKSTLEAQTNGSLRRIAADNALSFLELQLHNSQFKKYIDRRRAAEQSTETALLPSIVDAKDVVADELTEILARVHIALSNLSPDYKGKPKGYRLPLPRIRAAQAKVGVGPAKAEREPIDILDAIAQYRIVSIAVPRSFPDNSLPWIIAQELTLVELDGRQAVPYVIEGEKIVPPQGGLAEAGNPSIRSINNGAGGRPVVILTDFPTGSRTRVQKLIGELDAYPSAKFVIVNRDDSNVMGESELVLRTSAQHFNVCDVSFVELCGFLSRAFELEGQEAGVLAFRLREMFQKFKLSAHPSYFAGVGAELLTALLRANRRAELLSLAVGGYLSYVVASDSPKVPLSRTAREEFLRRLVVAMRVEKRAFTQAKVIAEAEIFSDEGDLGIDCIGLIKAFVDRGVIHFDRGNLQFSLPFMESYLLASELSNNKDIAARYFSSIDSNFDLETFDIYAELGPSDEVISFVENEIDLTLEGLRRNDRGENYLLLTDELRPAIVDKRVRVAEIEQRLERAFEDVVNNRPNNGEKQKILDIASRVQDSAREAREIDPAADTRERQEGFERLNSGFKIWGAATTLLGSGAERIKKDPKRSISAKIANLTALLVDEALVVFPRVEFDNLKKMLTDDATLRRLSGIGDDEPIPATQREFVETLIDAYEFSLLGYPLRATLEHLGNAAGQPVLWNSVSAIQTDDPMVNLVAKIWASEIDAVANKKELISAIRALPPTPFLMLSLSTFFMIRVFWNHWESSKRLALLGAANESLSKVSTGGLDVARIERSIRQDQEIVPKSV